jgi:hypothetical protein
MRPRPLRITPPFSPSPIKAVFYDANDRLATDSYDANGNTTASGGNTYAYDFENKLLGQDNSTVTIIYDGDGNRVSKTAGGVTVKYLVDDRNLTGYAQVVEEVSTGTVQRVYTYGLNRISQSQASGDAFLDGNLRIARSYAAFSPRAALEPLGKNLHAIADSTSPAHAGFQPWYNAVLHPDLAVQHVLRESFASEADKIRIAGELRNYYDDVFQRVIPVQQAIANRQISTDYELLTGFEALSATLIVLSR